MERAANPTGLPAGRTFSRRELFLVFAAVVLPIYSWAILQYLGKMIGWIYYLTIWDLLSLLAYVLSFAFLESALVTAGFLALAIVLPRALFRQKLVPLTMAMMLALTLGAVIYHYFEGQLRGFLLAPVLLLCGVVIVILYLGVQRKPAVARRFHELAERASILLYLYIPLSALSVAVVILRNIR